VTTYSREGSSQADEQRPAPPRKDYENQGENGQSGKKAMKPSWFGAVHLAVKGIKSRLGIKYDEEKRRGEKLGGATGKAQEKTFTTYCVPPDWSDVVSRTET